MFGRAVIMLIAAIGIYGIGENLSKDFDPYLVGWFCGGFFALMSVTVLRGGRLPSFTAAKPTQDDVP